MGQTTFSGPLRTGVNTGATATSTIGYVPVTQVATVLGNSSGATNMVIPRNANIVRWELAIVSNASAATSINSQGINFRIGRVTGNDAYFATIKASAIGYYPLGSVLNPISNFSAASHFGAAAVTADTQVFVDATAVTSASAQAQMGGRLYCTYFQQ